MNRSDLKVLAVLGAVLLGATSIYLAQRAQLSRLRSENSDLAAEQERLNSGAQTSVAPSQTQMEEIDVAEAEKRSWRGCAKRSHS